MSQSDQNQPHLLNRRSFLRLGAAASGLSVMALLQACGGAAPTPTTAAPAAAPTATKAAAATTAPTAASAGGGGATPGATRAASPASGSAPSSPASPASPASPTTGTRVGITAAEWNPDSIKANAGTLQVDTKADVAKITPLDYKGKLNYWFAGTTQASPQLDIDIENQYFEAWNKTYPGIPLKVGDNAINSDYGQMLDKIRTAAAGGAAPDTARMPILWGVEFAAKGQLQEVKLEEFGFKKENFWTGALKSVTWNGKYYGVPTNNETMGFIWNKKQFANAGLDPEKAPATWADVVAYSKQIKDKTGKAGFGMVAKQNHGNTPFRFMPLLWAYGSGALDEAEAEPTYQKVLINNEGGIAALQLYYDMYIKDKSVPTSALTNSQTENGDLFISEQIAMVISHPSEYAAMVDKAKKATGPDKAKAEEIVANMAYGLIPAGPVRRAVVFGGSNFHIFTDKAVGRAPDRKATNALCAFECGPEWSVKRAWSGSNPGHLDGFKTIWMKERLEQIKFLEVTTSMLPYGVPFPVIPESTQIMNIIVPDMLQNMLTQKMTVKQAADDAADKIKKLIAERKV